MCVCVNMDQSCHILLPQLGMYSPLSPVALSVRGEPQPNTQVFYLLPVLQKVICLKISDKLRVWIKILRQGTWLLCINYFIETYQHAQSLGLLVPRCLLSKLPVVLPVTKPHLLSPPPDWYGCKRTHFIALSIRGWCFRQALAGNKHYTSCRISLVEALSDFSLLT